MVTGNRIVTLAVSWSCLALPNAVDAFAVIGGISNGLAHEHTCGRSSSSRTSMSSSCSSLTVSSPLSTCCIGSGAQNAVHRRQTTVLHVKKRRRRRVDEDTGGKAQDSTPPPLASAASKTAKMIVKPETIAVIDKEEEDVEIEDEVGSGNVLAGGILMPPTASEIGAVIGDDNPFDLLKINLDYNLLDRDLAPGEALGSTMMTPGELKKKPKKSYYSFDLEVPLPVESEIIGDGGFVDILADKPSLLSSSSKAGKGGEGGGVKGGSMPLPDLKDVAAVKELKKKAELQAKSSRKKISRSDSEAYVRLLEMDPDAESEMDSFNEESYDLMASILGEGSAPFLGLPNSFLQSGHTVLLVLCLLCGFIYYPGFPLTELPYDIRMFIQKGLLITFVINIPIAALAFKLAGEKKQPAFFWAFKSFVLGGLSYNELSQVKVVVDEGTKNKRKLRKSER